jgi:hypothetical protein
MNLGPLDQQPFSKLLKRVGQGEEIPWRASFLIETSVLERQKLREVFASLAGLTSPDNSRPLYLALQAAKEANAKGRPPVGLQAIFSTWASVGELKKNSKLRWAACSDCGLFPRRRVVSHPSKTHLLSCRWIATPLLWSVGL